MTDKQVLKTIGEDPASGKKLSRAAVWNLRLTTAASLGDGSADAARRAGNDRGSDDKSRNVPAPHPCDPERQRESLAAA